MQGSADLLKMHLKLMGIYSSNAEEESNYGIGASVQWKILDKYINFNKFLFWYKHQQATVILKL